MKIAKWVKDTVFITILCVVFISITLLVGLISTLSQWEEQVIHALKGFQQLYK
jgi:hypothetical protein